MTDLSLVPTDDLLDELESRFDSMIYAAVKELGPAIEVNNHLHRWKGHTTFCAGMATDLIRAMQDWADQDPDDEEPT